MEALGTMATRHKRPARRLALFAGSNRAVHFPLRLDPSANRVRSEEAARRSRSLFGSNRNQRSDQDRCPERASRVEGSSWHRGISARNSLSSRITRKLLKINDGEPFYPKLFPAGLDSPSLRLFCPVLESSIPTDPQRPR